MVPSFFLLCRRHEIFGAAEGGNWNEGCSCGGDFLIALLVFCDGAHELDFIENALVGEFGETVVLRCGLTDCCCQPCQV